MNEQAGSLISRTIDLAFVMRQPPSFRMPSFFHELEALERRGVFYAYRIAVCWSTADIDTHVELRYILKSQ
jgi:hypothetical protein